MRVGPAVPPPIVTALVARQILAPSARSNPTAFQAVRSQPPDPRENRRDGGIQTKHARGVRPGVYLVWCTEYRYKILCGRIAEHARHPIRLACQSRDVVSGRRAVSPDQCALLLSAPPLLCTAPAKLAQYIEGAVVPSPTGGVPGVAQTV